MGFQLMKVGKYLCCKADVAFITTKLVCIVVVIELFFCFKSILASFTLKGYV